MTNPYAYLSAEKFWRSGVADQDTSRTFDNIWTSRFPLEKTTKFLTAGSCFAQHISKWLISNGYQWIDTEPAPAEMSDAERLENNYGVFSFRTGNIYTSSLLRQWLEQALTISPSPIEEVFVEDGRYFDPLRPLISKNGFATKEELLTARTLTVQNIKTGFENADVFIFTLGLTESWKHKVGYTYAMCPGTAKGTFDRETVLFENLDYQTILFDLERCFELIKSVNPEMKFLLTVSPVPLTATASEDHVLPATIYSKSVLRGVAGHLKATREDVDYFPSYELISSFPIRGAYYEENLRSVKPSGVEFVMRHFEQGISTPQAAVSEKTGAQPPVPAAVAKDQNEDDVLCDEVMLENWNPHKSVSQADHYCLIGDSHMGLLSESLTRLGVSNAGGMIMNGAAWTSNLFHLDGEEFFVPLENKLSRAKWQQTLPFFQQPKKRETDRKIVFSNIGQHTHRSVGLYRKWLSSQGIKPATKESFFKYYLQENKQKMAVLYRIKEVVDKVVIISDPPTQHLHAPHQLEFWKFYEALSEHFYRDIGCEFFSARNHIEEIGFRDEFVSEKYHADDTSDWFHGSKLYYEEIARTLLKLYPAAA